MGKVTIIRGKQSSEFDKDHAERILGGKVNSLLTEKWEVAPGQGLDFTDGKLIKSAKKVKEKAEGNPLKKSKKED